MNTKRLAWLLAVLMIVLTTVPISAQSDAAYPLTVTNAGATLTLTREPKKVVSLSYSAAETMALLGAGDRLSALSTHGNDVADAASDARAALSQVTSLEKAMKKAPEQAPTLEAMLKLAPDLIIVDSYALTAKGIGTRADYETNNIPVYVTEATAAKTATLDNTIADIKALGRIFHAERRADELVASMTKTLDTIQQALGDVKPTSVMVFNSFVKDKPLIAGQGNIMSDLVKRAGGENVFQDVDKPFALTSIETILERNPEVIAVLTYGTNTLDKVVASLEAKPELKDVKAIKDKRYVAIPLLWTRSSVQNATAVAMLAHACHPDRVPLMVSNAGATLTLKREPKKVVSLSYSAAETMALLGAGDRLSALSTHGNSPADAAQDARQALSQATSLETAMKAKPGQTPSLEAMLALAPDLIVADAYALTPKGIGTRADYDKNDIPVYVTEATAAPSASIANTIADIRALGRIFQAERKADQLVEAMKTKLSAIGKALGDVKPKPVMVFNSFIKDKPLIAGQSNIMSDMVARAGGQNVFQDVAKPFALTSIETILERDPEVIAVLTYGANTLDKVVASLEAKPELKNVKAIKNKRYVAIPLLWTRSSVRNTDAVARLAHAIHPDRVTEAP